MDRTDLEHPFDPIDRHAQQRHDHARAEELLAQVEATDDAEERERLRQEVVLLTMDLADTVARRYRSRGIDHEDLVQVGRMALVKAVRGYRCGAGNSFPAYAVPTISGEIKRHFRDFGWAVRPPRRLQELRAGLAAAEDTLRQELGREPTREELGAALVADAEQVAEAQLTATAYHCMSLDAPTPTGVSLADSVVHEPTEFGRIEDHDALARALTTLSDRERRILALRFVEEHTQAEIGAALSVSQMQVSRLLSSILGRLRDELADQQEDERGDGRRDQRDDDRPITSIAS
jgi:RNA polymerase sigma-B factor